VIKYQYSARKVVSSWVFPYSLVSTSRQVPKSHFLWLFLKFSDKKSGIQAPSF